MQKIITSRVDEGLIENPSCWSACLHELSRFDDFHHGLVLDVDEFDGCLRFRLDCTGSTEPIVRAVCNSVMLDSGASHASCCVISEATRGQYAVADPVHESARACDSNAEAEVLGLGPGSDLPPADVLTSAPSNDLTALDVCVRTNSTVATKLTHFASPTKHRLRALRTWLLLGGWPIWSAAPLRGRLRPGAATRSADAIRRSPSVASASYRLCGPRGSRHFHGTCTEIHTLARTFSMF